MRSESNILEMTERLGVADYPSLSKTAENIEGGFSDSNIMLDFIAPV